jgi:hypothetical protein
LEFGASLVLGAWFWCLELGFGAWSLVFGASDQTGAFALAGKETARAEIVFKD